jgi:hypothetical protein
MRESAVRTIDMSVRSALMRVRWRERRVRREESRKDRSSPLRPVNVGSSPPGRSSLALPPLTVAFQLA